MKSTRSTYNFLPDFYNKVYADVVGGFDDESSQLEYAPINKEIHEIVTTKIFKNLNLPLPQDSSPYSEVMKYFKSHCKFFIERMPNPISGQYDTITKMKSVVDHKLANQWYSNKTFRPLLQKIWSDFLDQIDTSPNPNQSIPFFIRAGACTPESYPNFAQAVIKKNWCNLETVTFLKEYGFEMKFEGLDQFESLDQIDQSANPNITLQLLIQEGSWNPKLYPDLLELSMKKNWCTLETVHLLINAGFEVKLECVTLSCFIERFRPLQMKLVQLLKRQYRCPIRTLFKQIPYMPVNIKYELKNYIDQVYKKPSTDDILFLIEGGLSEDFVSKMILRLPEPEQHSTHYLDMILTAAFKKEFSSIQFFESFLLKVTEDQIPGYLEEILTHSSCKEIVFKFLVPENKGFNPWKFRFSTTMTTLIQTYPESILSKIIEHVDSVSWFDINIALMKGCSAAIILQMQAKPRQ